MRPILAINCLLQIAQERSEEENSVGDSLALAFRCIAFCLASLSLFASYLLAPLRMRPSHFVILCDLFSRLSFGMSKSLREVLRGCPCIASSDHHGSVFLFVVLHRGCSLANVYQAFW